MEQRVKELIVGGVRAVFNDQAGGESPVVRRTDGLFGPASIAWRVHGDVTTMMVGGIAALLLQMLHPAVLAGVWDHSNFRNDMLGRLRRTARFIAVTTYGGRDEAERAIERVRRIHDVVQGTLDDGQSYSASDPELLGWVHATETLCFLDSWRRYGEPDMPLSEQDRYFDEVARVARRLGAVSVPTSRSETIGYIEAMRPSLRVDARTREIARVLRYHRPESLAALPVQQMVFQAGIDLLPAWARRMHGFRSSGLTRPLVDGSTLGMARMLRWAFR